MSSGHTVKNVHSKHSSTDHKDSLIIDDANFDELEEDGKQSIKFY